VKKIINLPFSLLAGAVCASVIFI